MGGRERGIERERGGAREKEGKRGRVRGDRERGGEREREKEREREVFWKRDHHNYVVLWARKTCNQSQGLEAFCRHRFMPACIFC